MGKLFGNKKGNGKVLIPLTISGSINIKNYTSNWANLTITDFVIGITGFNANVWNAGLQPANYNANTYLSKSYNATTGILSLSAPSASVATYNNATNTATISMLGLFAYLLI